MVAEPPLFHHNSLRGQRQNAYNLMRSSVGRFQRFDAKYADEWAKDSMVPSRVMGYTEVVLSYLSAYGGGPLILSQAVSIRGYMPKQRLEFRRGKMLMRPSRREQMLLLDHERYKEAELVSSRAQLSL
jgi:hypothetical protein